MHLVCAHGCRKRGGGGGGGGGAQGAPRNCTSTCRSVNHADLRTICDIMNSLRADK